MKFATAFLVASLIATFAAAHVLQPELEVPHPWYKSRSTKSINMEQSLDMTISLKRRNLDKLDAVFWEVSDPKNAKYGEHLQHDEMRKLIGAGQPAINAVKAWLAVHGIHEVDVARHEDSMKFKATVAQVASLLKVKFSVYENKLTRQQIPRALGAYQIPEELVSIVELVAGHRGFPFPKVPRVKVQGPPWGMNVTPAVIWDVYNEDTFPPTPAGQHNIQSFFQAQGQYVRQADLTQFCQGLMGPNFNGECKIEKYIGHDSNSDPGLESSLDSQYITATGYGLETWVYSYEGLDFCKDLLSWGQDVFGEKDGKFPYVISMSYGSQTLPTYCTGDGLNRITEDVKKMGAMGITVVIASGDSGSGEFSRSGWNWGYLGVSFPAEIPYATSVGSTTFESGNSGTERAATFSGGGFSFSFAAPEFQKDAIHHYLTTATPLPKATSYNATGRGTPDVSALGEQFFVIDDGVPQAVAGTSCSTPTFAGMVARLNNIRLQNNKTLGFINPLLYANPQGFNDITSGTNDMNHDGNGWVASAGWDPVTGLGTPDFKKLSTIVKNINAQERSRK